MANIYKTWQERIDSGVFTKSMCQQFGQAIARQAAGYPAHGKRTNIDREEANLLYDRIHERGGVRLTPEHETQGLEWLRKYGTKVLDLPAVALDLFSHFLYMGDVEISDGYSNQTLPVWRIVLTDGREIDYYNAAWQTGDATGWWWVADAKREREAMNR